MLSEKVRSDLATAMKEQRKAAAGTLRLLLSALEYKKMQKMAELSTEEEIAVIKSEVKKRQEAIEIYSKAGEAERAAVEKEELLVLREYLPEQVGEEEVEKVAKEVIGQLGEGANRGQVIGAVIGKIGRDKVDGAVVSKVVNQLLA